MLLLSNERKIRDHIDAETGRHIVVGCRRGWVQTGDEDPACRCANMCMGQDFVLVEEDIEGTAAGNPVDNRTVDTARDEACAVYRFWQRDRLVDGCIHLRQATPLR